jgi:hypothetical protein
MTGKFRKPTGRSRLLVRPSLMTHEAYRRVGGVIVGPFIAGVVAASFLAVGKDA